MTFFGSGEYGHVDPWYWHAQEAKKALADPEVGCVVAQTHAMLAQVYITAMVQDRLAEIGTLLDRSVE